MGVLVAGVLCAGVAGADAPALRYDFSRFHIGTVSGVTTQSVGQVRLLKEANIDIVTWFNGVDRETLDRCWGSGIASMVQHALPGWTGGTGKYAGKMREMRPMSDYAAAIARFGDHPGVVSHVIADEPSAWDYDYLAEVRAHVEQACPGVLGGIWVCPCDALPRNVEGAAAVNRVIGTRTYREYIEQFVRKIQGPLIWYDVYPWAWKVTREQFFECLETVADVARRQGKEVHVSLQASRFGEGGVTNRCITANMMRGQMFSAMAYGAGGVDMTGWQDAWWIEQPLSGEGLPTPAYYRLKEATAGVRAIADDYIRFRSVSTVREKADDGAELLVGAMKARDGSAASARLYVAIDDIEDEHPAAHPVSFRPAADRTVRAIGSGGPVALDRAADGRLTFSLRSNDAVLVIEELGSAAGR